MGKDKHNGFKKFVIYHSRPMAGVMSLRIGSSDCQGETVLECGNEVDTLKELEVLFC
jgi:hypothetical protein